MQIVAVDDEPLMLEKMKRSIKEAEPDSKLFTFATPKEVLKFAENIRWMCFFSMSACREWMA